METITTKNEALKVKKWRTSGMTFRRIAEKAYKEWPNKYIIPDNQISGKQICRDASYILIEDMWNW